MSDARDYVGSILVMSEFKAVILLSDASKHSCATKYDLRVSAGDVGPGVGWFKRVFN
jgi:hypothetical protein